MQLSSRPIALTALPLALSVLALGLACGGSGSEATVPPAATGTAAIILTDAPSDQWSSVEVAVTRVTLRSKADHAREVVVFQGAGARVNLVDLDSVGELLATAQVPVGTYDAVRIAIDPASVSLVRADGTVVPAGQVRVAGSSVLVDLGEDLVVTAGGSNALQVDFDLAHPLFLVQLPDGSWMLTLQVRHRLNQGGMTGMAQMMLRHRRGTLASVGASSFVLRTDTGTDLTIRTDAGTWYFDGDARAMGSFAGLSAGKHALVSLRMQADGSLWAVRVWYGATALPGWTPEGHVYGVDRTANQLILSASNGAPRTILIDADTAFTFRATQSLGTGPAALGNLWAGFKVQVEVKDPLQAQLHARSVNVQRAVDGGVIGAADASQLTYTHVLAGDRSYSYDGAFSWWYLGLPGLASGSSSAFAAAVAGAGEVRSQSVSDLTWNGGASAWHAANAVFVPVALPQGTISASYSGGQMGFTFTTSAGGAQTIPVSLNPAAGLQPAVMEVVNQAGVVTVSPVGESAWAAKLVAPAKARVAVVPKPDGSFAAYAVVVFTGF